MRNSRGVQPQTATSAGMLLAVAIFLSHAEPQLPSGPGYWQNMAFQRGTMSFLRIQLHEVGVAAGCQGGRCLIVGTIQGKEGEAQKLEQLVFLVP